MKTEYRKYLTDKEAFIAMNLGMAAESGQPEMQKAAGIGGVAAMLPGAGMAALKTIAAISVVAGVPLGVAAHALSKGTKITNNKERDALNRIKYYHTAADEMESRLARKGAVV